MQKEALPGDVLPIREKRGIKVYRVNPSIPGNRGAVRLRDRRIGDARKGMIVDPGTGEFFGEGSVVFYEAEEVDSSRFVKLFLDGIRKTAELSKMGLAVFEIVFNQMQESPGQDTVMLAFEPSGLSKYRFYEGLRELLEKEFLFRSPFDGQFFINIKYMFNGDRLAFVKAYHLKGARKKRQKVVEGQLALPDMAE